MVFSVASIVAEVIWLGRCDVGYNYRWHHHLFHCRVSMGNVGAHSNRFWEDSIDPYNSPMHLMFFWPMPFMRGLMWCAFLECCCAGHACFHSIEIALMPHNVPYMYNELPWSNQFMNDRCVPKARVASADINGCYLEDVVQVSPVKGLNFT